MIFQSEKVCGGLIRFERANYVQLPDIRRGVEQKSALSGFRTTKLHRKIDFGLLLHILHTKDNRNYLQTIFRAQE